MKKFDKLKWQREYRKNNRPTQTAYLRKYMHRLRDAARNKLGSRCANPECLWINADGSKGCSDQRCLQIDHVLGGGQKERRKYKNCGRSGFYKRVLKDKKGRYQLLCANCNWIKRFLNKEFSTSSFKYNPNAEGVM